MSVLHVQRQGAALHLEGDVLRVTSGTVTIAAARLPLLERVYLHGAVQMSARVMARLLDDGIDCVLLTADGRYRGRLESARSGAGIVRALQARAAADPRLRLRAARVIVLHKIAAQQRALRVLLRRREGDPELVRAARAATAAAAMDEVRGCEGWAARRYFRGIAGAAEWSRGRRPARDPLNALLNYGYALLRGRVHAAVCGAGLDPAMGFLHGFGRPRPAFVLDMMEEFRAPVVDVTCVRLARRLGEVGWYEKEQETGAVRLNETGRVAIIAAMERRFHARLRHRPTGRRVELQHAIELQVGGFAAALRGGRLPYRGMW